MGGYGMKDSHDQRTADLFNADDMPHVAHDTAALPDPVLMAPANLCQQASEYAARMFKRVQRDSYIWQTLHCYTDATGQPLYWKTRAKHPDTGEKWIRAFHWDGQQFVPTEPPKPEAGKPLYGLHLLVNAEPAQPFWIVEGEQKADALNRLGLIATTSGGKSSPASTDWTPLTGRSVIAWPDHDEAGQQYADDVAKALTAIGCPVSVVDTAALALPSKGDVMDWLTARDDAGLTTTSADVEALARTVWQLVAEPVADHADADFIDTLLESATRDIGLLWEPDAVEAIRRLYDSSPAQYARLRVRLKALRDLKLSDYEKVIVPASDAGNDQSMAARLVELAADQCRFIHDSNMDTYAVMTCDQHRECWPLDSRTFSEWLSFNYYRMAGSAPNDQAIRSAIAALKGEAKYEGQQQDVFTRIAYHDDAYWLDLCNNQWQAIRITQDGWQVIDAPPVLFTRTPSMRPLPLPQAGTGDLSSLWPAVNIPEDDQLTVLAWLLECLRPETPFLILELSGEQGSAKSSTASRLRDLIDPNRANLRAAPKSKDDIFISAKNAHMVCLENISHLSADYQDALCTLATGGGYATRTLYTNAEESVIELKKPVIVNGIPAVVTAQDLTDRVIHLDLPVLANVVAETDIAIQWQASYASVFTGLLDLFVKVLVQLPQITQQVVSFGRMPRMADFTLLGEAVYQVSGRPAGEFLQRYREQRAESAQRSLEASPVAVAMIAYLEDHPSGYYGTVKDLWIALDDYREGAEAWPKSARGLGDAIQRIKPALRQIGIELSKDNKSSRQGIMCRLKWAYIQTPENMSADVHNVHNVNKTSEIGQKTANLAPEREHRERCERHAHNLPADGYICHPNSTPDPAPASGWEGEL